MDEEESSTFRECSDCFLREEIPCVNETVKAILPLCDVCKKDPVVGEKLLERQLKVMQKALLSRFPQIIRLMYKVLKEKNDKRTSL